MLLDRGLLVQEGTRYVVTGDVSDLEVPETLQALVASRLDNLDPAERSLLQDASVLGQSFTAAAAAARQRAQPEAEVRRVLDGLVAKQVLARDDDPRSPERGQYVFLQALLRTVAYGTLSRRARKAGTSPPPAISSETWPARSAATSPRSWPSTTWRRSAAEPEADDVGRAARVGVRDADRGRTSARPSLALGPEARRYFEHAAELAERRPRSGRSCSSRPAARCAPAAIRRPPSSACGGPSSCTSEADRAGRRGGDHAGRTWCAISRAGGRGPGLLDRFRSADGPASTR